jgi:hypothetical protein
MRPITGDDDGVGYGVRGMSSYRFGPQSEPEP